MREAISYFYLQHGFNGKEKIQNMKYPTFGWILCTETFKPAIHQQNLKKGGQTRLVRYLTKFVAVLRGLYFVKYSFLLRELFL